MGYRIISFLLAIYCLQGCKTVKPSSRQVLPVRSVVFEPGGSYAAMRIPALVYTKAGSLLAFCEARIDSAGDQADMDLLMRRSTNGGRSWEAPVVIAAHTKGPVGNPVPVVDRDGTVHLLYQRGYAHAYYTRSVDDGKTWSDAVDITYAFDAFKPDYPWQVLATGPGHSIQLKNGRLLVAVWLREPAALVPQRTYRVATIYSDDAGMTWKRGAILPDVPEVKNPNESMAVELADGRVLMNIRNNAATHRRGLSYSPDGISNWTIPVVNNDLFEPVCMASTIRVSDAKEDGKSRLLFVNPDSRAIAKYPRKNLVAKLSYDEGKSWPVQKVIDSSLAGYSDVAVSTDGTIYCLYETHTTGTGWKYSLVLKRFTATWIEDTLKE
jgi:sialidase-1